MAIMGTKKHPVPDYLKGRELAGQALPQLEIASPSEGHDAAKRDCNEEQRAAVLHFVVHSLPEELYTELMEGFRRLM